MTGVQRLFRVSDFEKVLCQEPLPLLVGGQAVNLWANLVENTLSVVTGDYARRVSQSEQLDFLQCFPEKLEAGPLPKVQSFCHHRLAPLRSTGSK